MCCLCIITLPGLRTIPGEFSAEHTAGKAILMRYKFAFPMYFINFSVVSCTITSLQLLSIMAIHNQSSVHFQAGHMFLQEI